VQLPGSQCQVSRAEWSTGKASQGQTQPSIVRIRTQAEHCVQHKASSTPSVLLDFTASAAGLRNRRFSRCVSRSPGSARGSKPNTCGAHGAPSGACAAAGRVRARAAAFELPCGLGERRGARRVRQRFSTHAAAELPRGAELHSVRMRSHTYAQPVRRPGIWRKPAPSCLGQQRAAFQGRLCGRTHTRQDLTQQHA